LPKAFLYFMGERQKNFSKEDPIEKIFWAGREDL
jgi:hypothetical protein